MEKMPCFGAGGVGSAAAIALRLGGVPDWMTGALAALAGVTSSTDFESESDSMMTTPAGIDTRGTAGKRRRASRPLSQEESTGRSIQAVAALAEEAEDTRSCSPFRNDNVLSSCTTSSLCDLLATYPPVVDMMHEKSHRSPDDDDADDLAATACEKAEPPRPRPATHGATTGSESHSLASCSLLNVCTKPTSSSHENKEGNSVASSRPSRASTTRRWSSRKNAMNRGTERACCSAWRDMLW